MLGVSVDSRFSLRVYREQLGLEFPLLSDFPHRTVSQAYGVYNAKRGAANRTTFVIDKDGIIRRIDSGSDALEIGGVRETCSGL